MNKKIFDEGTTLPKKFLLTKEFTKIFELIEKENLNLFITGKAGTGKSTFLEYFRNKTKKNHAILAPTGITAIKAKGKTIHSFFKFPPRFIVKDDVKLLKDKQLLQRLDTLLIDESSMIRSDIFDGIDYSLKINRGNNKPFGGVQIVLLGDLFQLPPVVSGSEKEVIEKFYPEGEYFFNSKCFPQGNFKIKELTKIFRQSDKNFIDLLNKFRLAEVNHEDLKIINRRRVSKNYEVPKGAIVLSPRNRKVDEINNTKLEEIKSKSFSYEAVIHDSFKENEYPVKKTLNLKVGAQVMITKNDISEEKKYVNGTLATIVKLSNDEIKVKIKDKIINLPKSKWEKIDYRLSGNNINPKVIGRFIQYPLKLAWAATIHKCQGQTFDEVAIDLDEGAFTHGQTYVALSRAKTIEGIHLLNDIKTSDLFFDKNVFKFLGHKLQDKYKKELRVSKQIEKGNINNLSDKKLSDWSDTNDKKLLALYNRKVPEIALSKIFKKRRTEIRERVIYLMNKQ